MFMIILYHLFFFFEFDNKNYDTTFKPLWLPLHIGVLEFVLISGYFRIKRSFYGLLKLIVPVFFYFVGIHVVVATISDDWSTVNFHALTSGPYWFILTYLYLYLLSPMINHYLECITLRSRIILLSSLFFINYYVGNYCIADNSLVDGKNIINFICLYVIGDTLHQYEHIERRIKTLHIILVYVILNVSMVALYVRTCDSGIGTRIWQYGYNYNGMLLLFNSVLLFLIFSRMSFCSKFVNRIASSVFSMYIIHHQSYVLYGLIGKCVSFIEINVTNNWSLFFAFVILSIIIMMICFLVDILFSPLIRFLIIKIVSIKQKLSVCGL